MNIYMILDESGSMGPLQNDTIGGLNRFLKEQRELEATEVAILHIACFSTRSGSIIRRPIWGRDVREVYDFTTKDYSPGGGTPLLDAVGEVVSNASGSRGLIVIATDGEENESRHYSKSQVKELLQTKQEQGWTVLFFGANIDAFAEAGKIGVRAQSTTWYSPTNVGTAGLYHAATQTASHLRTGGTSSEVHLGTNATTGAPEVTLDKTKTTTPTK